YLQKRLPVLKIVEQPPTDNTIRFGAWITVCDEDGSESRYRIVGADEIDREDGYISIDAPVARALLGKTVDDEVAVDIGGRQRLLEVLAVHYDP
ncbi:MAG: transcription elongation factor GreB, partial [Gammaproteobacteria bacterium]|nr:transcription elongation factor GreB [Gammaproteobacteria bacterium]